MCSSCSRNVDCGRKFHDSKDPLNGFSHFSDILKMAVAVRLSTRMLFTNEL